MNEKLAALARRRPALIDHPPFLAPADAAPARVRTRRMDLVRWYADVLATRWGRPVSRREAVDAALMIALHCETAGHSVAGRVVAEDVEPVVGRPPARDGADGNGQKRGAR